MEFRQTKSISVSAASSGASLSAALLAGGWSRRMGQDKAFLKFAGDVLWKRQLTTLKAGGFSPLQVACRREQNLGMEIERWAASEGVDARMVYDPSDALPMQRGALAAVLRCLELTAEPMLVMAVDMPLVTEVFLRVLLEVFVQRQSGLVVCCEGRVEPLISIWHPHCILTLQSALAQPHQPSLRKLLEEEVEAGRALRWEVPSGLVACLANWNQPSDLPRKQGQPPLAI